VEAGSVGGDEVSIIRIDPRAHPAVQGLLPGRRFAVSGLYRTGREGVFGVRDTGLLMVDA
jgi:hypothetical protein